MGDSPIHLVIASRPAEVAPVQQAILEQVEAHGYDREARFAIRLALDEALTNAIRHGNAGDPDLRVTVDASVTDQSVTITVCDEGEGFRLEDLPDPTREENLRHPHGRGVMLMRAYMTEVRFNERRNCVTMIKKRDDRGPRHPTGPAGGEPPRA